MAFNWNPARLPQAEWTQPKPIDLSPINRGIAQFVQGQKDARDLETRQAAGNLLARGDNAGAENALFQAGMVDQGLNLRSVVAQQQSNAADASAKAAQRAAGLAQMAATEQDPNRKAAIWKRVLSIHPDMAKGISEAGVDPNDIDTASKYVIAEARGYVDPTEAESKKLGLEKDRASIDLARAQADAARRKADDPLAVFLASKLNPQSPSGPTPSQGQPPPTVQPQSFEGAGPQPMLQPASNVTGQPGGAQPQPAPGIILTGNETPSEPEAAPPQQAQSPSAVYSMPGNEIVQTPLGPMSRDQARTIGALSAAKGRGDFGKMMIDAASGGPQKLGQTGSNQLDKNSLNTVDEIAGLDNIKRSYDAKFLNIPNRIGYAWKSVLSQFGKLKPEDAQDLKDYATFRASAFDQLNKKMKELSGTAVTPQEAARQLMVLPNAGRSIGDGDSPAEFEAKLNASIGWTKAAYARQNYLRAQGFQGRPWEAGISVDDMPAIINQRGQQLRQQLQQQFPKASPMQLDQTVTKRIKQEFGI